MKQEQMEFEPTTLWKEIQEHEYNECILSRRNPNVVDLIDPVNNVSYGFLSITKQKIKHDRKLNKYYIEVILSHAQIPTNLGAVEEARSAGSN